MRIVPATLLALLLAACGTPGPATAPYTYACEDSTVLQVRFGSDGVFVTPSGGAEVFLPQQRAGSGTWYASGGQELRGKGRDATWRQGSLQSKACRLTGLPGLLRVAAR